jgi:hypothetical protein
LRVFLSSLFRMPMRNLLPTHHHIGGLHLSIYERVRTLRDWRKGYDGRGGRRELGVTTMLTKSVAAAAVAIALGAAPASVARDKSPPAPRAGGPPTIDIQKTCRENVDALRAIQGVGGQDMDVCLSDERDAQQQLVKEWSSYPAFAKSQCVQTGEFLPGYVEWLSCIQMTRDVLNLRKQEGAGAPEPRAERWSSGRRAGSSTEECPFVKYTDNGSIVYVTNC